MRPGWFASPVLHLVVVAVGLFAFPQTRPDLALGETAVVPIEVVTTGDETNIRAARRDDIAEIAPEPLEAGEQFAPPDSTPPPEPIPSLEPAPTPPREPPRRERQFDLADVESLLRSQTDAPRGNSSRNAAPAGERAERSRAAAGAGTAMTASMEARIAGLLREKMQACWRDPADRANAEALRVDIQLRLTRDGALEQPPRIAGAGSGDRVFDENALRAARLCAPYEFPEEIRAIYPAWREIRFVFAPNGG